MTDQTAEPVPDVQTVTLDPPIGSGTDVIVFVPGLGESEKNTPHHVAQILAAEFDKRFTDTELHFSVQTVSLDDSTVYRIQESSGKAAVRTIDLYCLEPKKAGPAASAFRKVLLLALTVSAGILIVAGAGFFRKNRHAKSPAQKWQMIYCLVALLLLGAYLIIAILALAQVVIIAINGSSEPIVQWPQWIVLIGGVVGALFPSLQQQISNAAELFLKMMRYLWTSRERNDWTGRLSGLVDRINGRKDVNAVHLMGFSFGSLVVIDTVYSRSSSKPAALRRLASIITIGCPFDLVRMLQPDFVKSRTLAAAEVDLKSRPLRWLNIFEPVDALASNFADGDATTSDRQAGLEVKGPSCGFPTRPTANEPWNPSMSLNLVNFLMLYSITSHGQYWSDDVGAETALGIVAAELLESVMLQPALPAGSVV